MQSLPTVSTDWLLDWARLLLAEYALALDEHGHAEDVMDRLQPVLIELFERGYSVTELLDRLTTTHNAVLQAA